MLSFGFSVAFAIILFIFIVKISDFGKIKQELGSKKFFSLYFPFLYLFILILIFSFLRYKNEDILKESKNQSNTEKELREKIRNKMEEANKKVEEHNFEMKFGRKKTEQEKMIEEKIERERKKKLEERIKKDEEESKKRLEEWIKKR